MKKIFKNQYRIESDDNFNFVIKKRSIFTFFIWKSVKFKVLNENGEIKYKIIKFNDINKALDILKSYSHNDFKDLFIKENEFEITCPICKSKNLSFLDDKFFPRFGYGIFLCVDCKNYFKNNEIIKN